MIIFLKDLINEMYGFIVWIVLCFPFAILTAWGFFADSFGCILIGLIMSIFITIFVISMDYGNEYR